MIIREENFICSVLPAKYYSPLLVHADAVKTLQVSFESFKTIAGWGAQIVQAVRGVDNI
jgi:hypothetical protein